MDILDCVASPRIQLSSLYLKCVIENKNKQNQTLNELFIQANSVFAEQDCPLLGSSTLKDEQTLVSEWISHLLSHGLIETSRQLLLLGVKISRDNLKALLPKSSTLGHGGSIQYIGKCHNCFLFLGPVHMIYNNYFQPRSAAWLPLRTLGLFSIYRIVLLLQLQRWLNALCFRSSFSSHLKYTLVNDLFLITLLLCPSHCHNFCSCTICQLL